VVELLAGDVRRLRDLVEELLELSRLDRADAAADVETSEVDVDRLLAAIVARRLPEAQVVVQARVRVRTDRRRLERIIVNLVDNARVHGDPAGGPVTVTAWVESATLVIEVADRGPGVPTDQLDRIFDRFTKADTARAGGGSGLGLAIVREHARVLGAEVTARNRDGGGFEIRLRLPVAVVTDL
jgi:two-component system sensor histidine kinase MtrB